MTREWLPALALAAAACGSDGTSLDVRTTLPAELQDEVETAFESAHPGIDVRFSEASADESLDALSSGDAGFDVWWGAPALALERAAEVGLLDSYTPEWAQAPERAQASEESAQASEESAQAAESAQASEESARASEESAAWHPVLTTPFVLAFDRTEVALGDAPTDWIDVFHHAWYQDVRMPDPAGTDAGAWLAGSMIVEGLRDDDDLYRGLDWLRRLHRQIDLYAQEPRDMIGALRRGDALLAVMTRADAETARTGDAPWLHYRVPTSGTPELMLGVGIVAGTDASEAARAFVDYIGTDVVATASKLHTRWEPAVGQVDASALPPDFELEQSWRGYAPAVDTLAAELDGWIERWEAEIAVR